MYVMVQQDSEPMDTRFSQEELLLHVIDGTTTHPVQVPMVISSNAYTLELDTGAAVTIMSQEVCQNSLSVRHDEY